MNRLLEKGVRVVGNSNGDAETAEAEDPFERRRAAIAMPEYAQGDWYIDAFGVAVGKLTPLVSSDAYQSSIQNYVIESLAVRDPQTLDWEPWIARSWDVTDGGLTTTMHLRNDVRFSDGHKLTADDVVFTYDWIMNPKVAAPRDRSYLGRLESVVKVDDVTVVFKLKEPYFQGFDLCAGFSVLAKHYYSQFTEEQFNESPGLLFGSGPYKLSVDPEEWKPGEGQIELDRNDKYWGVPPAYNRIVFKEISDSTARLVAFRNGETDRFGPQPEQYVKLKKDEDLNRDKNLYEFESINGGYRYVAWNQSLNDKPTHFADKRVRLAMTMLIDREHMCRTLQVGLATPNSGPFHRLGKQADRDIKPWPFDKKRALQLLKEAGFVDGDGDGVIEGPDGKAFKFKLIYPSSSVNYHQMALYLKDAYARAGIVLEPDPLEWTIMIQRISQRKFDAMTLGWTGTVEGDPYQIFHSAAIEDGGDNYTHYINPKLDKLIDEARITMNEDKRMKLWHQVHRILHEDQPYTFLWTSRAVIFIDKRIKNVQRVKLGLNGSMEWFVPLPMQRWSK
jgi:peptide/nickel transport system substrate-binding protein